ncbi:MAG TPA: 3-hydroxybutyryl-CoA dehydrogenase [Acetobacteraceae bacterium]|nr:3-hydroxybutyryl-CoA dehydrogenase [Acetobacteraceae bacterium]
MADLARIGVIGGGQMGSGIAHVAALAGIDVALVDADEAALGRARATIGKNLDRQVAKQEVSAGDKEAALKRIAMSRDLAALGGCELVIEAVPEREEIKRAVFASLLPHVSPDCILASNTSSISITRLAAGTDRPEKFIGMHFMNPVPVMKLIEVIRGIATSDATFEAVMTLGARMGKTMAVAHDFPGFIVNRILIPMINEAAYALHERVGDVTSIDAAMKLGANHPMGPLTLADLIGLDTCLEVMRVLHQGLGDSKYRPCPLLVNYVDAGWLGRKSGRGFYDYSGSSPTPTR